MAEEVGEAKPANLQSRSGSADAGKRVAQIRKGIDDTDSEYDREKFQERLAKLVGGVAVVSVGAATEAEMKQTKARMEDALHATRAAVEEGILPGGGTALLRCVKGLDEVKAKGDEKIGVEIVRRALQSPTKQIAKNAGQDGSVVADEVHRAEDPHGYNALTGVYEDLFAAGVIDPTKVVKSALTNAASIAGLMLTTQCLVTKTGEGEDKLPTVAGAVR
ncbi:60 kDa chaperonin [Alienimonas californiensis]|uniref:60 kDa chaperonin n=1 Tax=Alienimonas californiensis TaxID=2527989 RepID=A0A517P489_9PLAN|nr:TCP-1/cpn60 chaperonin family protein [Alienimonas californiensis]QDT14165.1 60 kDa chaperonin [Alienimonas californiensis]